MVILPDGWLDCARRYPSRRILPLVEDPQAIVWHTTDTVRANLAAMCERATHPPTPGERAASWHLLVARDGQIYQLCPIIQWGTWHVRGSGIIAGRKRVINATTIGIELENGGRAYPVAGGFFCDTPWKNGDETLGLDQRNRVDESEVEQVGHGYWHKFPAVQVDVAGELLAALHVALPNIADRELARGHFEFSTKEDPGPLWADRILPGLVGRAVSLGGTP